VPLSVTAAPSSPSARPHSYGGRGVGGQRRILHGELHRGRPRISRAVGGSEGEGVNGVGADIRPGGRGGSCGGVGEGDAGGAAGPRGADGIGAIQRVCRDRAAQLRHGAIVHRGAHGADARRGRIVVFHRNPHHIRRRGIVIPGGRSGDGELEEKVCIAEHIGRGEAGAGRVGVGNGARRGKGGGVGFAGHLHPGITERAGGVAHAPAAAAAQRNRGAVVCRGIRSRIGRGRGAGGVLHGELHCIGAGIARTVPWR